MAPDALTVIAPLVWVWIGVALTATFGGVVVEVLAAVEAELEDDAVEV
jgi:hypothetical protein